MFNILCRKISDDIIKLKSFLLENGQDCFVSELCDVVQLTHIFKSLCDTDIVFVSEEVGIAKNAVINAFDLKATPAISKTKCEGLQKHFEFESLMLPEGFRQLYNDSAAFFGRTPNRWFFCLSDAKKDLEQFKSILYNEGILDKQNKTYCFKLFGLNSVEIKEKMTQFVGIEFVFKICEDLYGDAALFLCFNGKTPFSTVESVIKSIYVIFSENIYADFNASLSEVLVHLATLADTKVSVAESLTGGMVASKIVDVCNASRVIDLSFVTYSNDAKHKLLGVKEDTLKQYGAVSEQTAREMAEGLLKCSCAGVAASTTGIAGPSGGSINKPVGLVFCAVATETHTDVYKNIFLGNREQVRQKTANFLIFCIIKALKTR